MKISELIIKLTEIKMKEGDINVCTSEPHEYWGSVESNILDGYNMTVRNAQPEIKIN